MSTQDVPHWVCPGGHVETHRPVAPSHIGVEPEQRVPHAPQFIAVLSGASQPLEAIESQFAKPVLQRSPHALATHSATALAPPAHALPHVPQLAVSVAVSTQRPAHRREGGRHAPLSTTTPLSSTPVSTMTPASCATPVSAVGPVSVIAPVSLDASGCAVTSSEDMPSIDEPPSLVDPSRSRVGTVVHAVAASSASRARDDEGRRRLMPLTIPRNSPQNARSPIESRRTPFLRAPPEPSRAAPRRPRRGPRAERRAGPAPRARRARPTNEAALRRSST